MVAIFKYMAQNRQRRRLNHEAEGLKFTGWIANSEEEALAYSDEKYDHVTEDERIDTSDD